MNIVNKKAPILRKGLKGVALQKLKSRRSGLERGDECHLEPHVTVVLVGTGCDRNGEGELHILGERVAHQGSDAHACLAVHAGDPRPELAGEVAFDEDRVNGLTEVLLDVQEAFIITVGVVHEAVRHRVAGSIVVGLADPDCQLEIAELLGDADADRLEFLVGVRIGEHRVVFGDRLLDVQQRTRERTLNVLAAGSLMAHLRLDDESVVSLLFLSTVSDEACQHQHDAGKSIANEHFVLLGQ